MDTEDARVEGELELPDNMGRLYLGKLSSLEQYAACADFRNLVYMENLIPRKSIQTALFLEEMKSFLGANAHE